MNVTQTEARTVDVECPTCNQHMEVTINVYVDQKPAPEVGLDVDVSEITTA